MTFQNGSGTKTVTGSQASYRLLSFSSRLSPRLEETMSLNNLVEDKLREQLLNMSSREPEKRSHSH